MHIKNLFVTRIEITLILLSVFLLFIPAIGSESENNIFSPEVLDEGGGKTISTEQQFRTSIGQPAIGISNFGDYRLYWGYIWFIHNPPSPPELVSPMDNDTVTTSFSNLRWFAPIDLERNFLHFIVQIAESEDFPSSIIHSYSSLDYPGDFVPSPPVPDESGICILNTPDSLIDGDYWWRVFAFDINDSSLSSEEWKFTVSVDTTDTVNHPPEIISEPAESIVYADSLWDYIVVVIDDDGDSLTFDVESDCGADISIDDTGYVTWIPGEDDTGECDITIIVCDEPGACDSQEFTIIVLPNNHPPEIISEPAESIVYVDSLWDYIVIADDEDDDSLTFSIESDCGADISIDDTGYVSWIPGEDDTGECTITITVCDDLGACDSQEFTIIVLPNNHPPEIVSDPPETIVYVDSLWDYIVVVIDDDGDSLTFDVESDCGADISIDDTGYVTWIPGEDDTGECDITITVCDDDTCVEQEFTIIILPNVPYPPPEFFAEACGPEVLLSWTPPEGAIEGYIIYRGLDSTSLEIIDTIPGDLLSAIDMPYPIDTVYHYAIAAFDSAGYLSPLSEIDTTYPFPYHINMLLFELTDDNQVELSWSPTTIDSLYLIFFAEGDTVPDFSDTTAIIYAPEDNWTSPPLITGTTYTFAVQALATCGYLDNSGNYYMIITIPDAEWECKRVHIKIPKPGKGLCGNCANVKADSDCSGAWWHDIDSVLFQKYYIPDAVWTDITHLSSDSLIHPNPSAGGPSGHQYFIHWWVDDELEGDYLIRAVAFDIFGIPDPYPDAIPVHIGPPCGHSDYGLDTSRGVPSGFVFEHSDRVYPHAASRIDIGDFDDTEDWIYLPNGFVETPDLLFFRMTNKYEETAPYFTIGEFIELELRSGESMVAGGDSIEFHLQYSDHDSDGFVDGRDISEDSLWFFLTDGSVWDSIDCTLDTENNTIDASNDIFGKYAILASYPGWIKEIQHPDKISMFIYPTPFNASLAVIYHIPSASDVSIDVHDILGHQITTIINEPQEAGTHSITWTVPENISSGIYFARLKAGDNVITKRSILIR